MNHELRWNSLPARRLSHQEVQDEVRRCVQMILLRRGAAACHAERRREKRHAFPHPIQLWSAEDTDPESQPPQHVLGRFLSAGGLDFYHDQPLPDRRVVVGFSSGGPTVYLLLELRWCRFGSHGLYEHGGRFLRLLETRPPGQSVGESLRDS